MRYVECAAAQDGMGLRNLARSTRANSYPALKGKVAEITLAYWTYLKNNGNATSITPLALDKALRKNLVAHYAQPPKSHLYIKKLRKDTAAYTCSMCGSPSCGTLDHVLPKEHFAEFSLFSRNLVPACLCNTKRGSEYKSDDGARVLHPYFDKILEQRLLGCVFDDHGPVPSLRIVNLLPITHPQFASVQFHIESVVLKTSIKASLRREWTNLLLKPSLSIRSLARNPRSHTDLVDLLQEELEIRDESSQSLNNWGSVFVGGLMRPNTSAWLFTAMTTVGRNENGPITGV